MKRKVSVRVNLRGMLRLIRVDTLRKVYSVGFLAGRLINNESNLRLQTFSMVSFHCPFSRHTAMYGPPNSSAHVCLKIDPTVRGWLEDVPTGNGHARAGNWRKTTFKDIYIKPFQHTTIPSVMNMTMMG